jgi:hypothetical protein
MAQTPIILLAMDYLLKGDGLKPSKAITQALAACGPLRTYGSGSEEEGESSDPNAGLDDLPIEVVLGNVEARIERLLGPGEQGIRRFVSIFSSASGASSMTTGILDAASALKNFQSFTDFGPNINNIQDLVTGGKTGSFPGGPEALTKIGNSLKGFGTMYNPSSLADMGKASSLIKNLSSQNALPSSVMQRLDSAGIDIDNMSDSDEATLKKILSGVSGTDLKMIGTVTKFPVEKLDNLGDALDANKVLPAGALAAIPRSPGLPTSFGSDIGGSFSSIVGGASTGPIANLGGSLYSSTPPTDLTYTGDDYIVWDRVNAERRKRGLPGLEDIGSPRPEEGAAAVGTQGGGDMSSLGTSLEAVAGSGDLTDIGKKLSSVKVPELRHLMAAPPDFSAISDSLKSKFTSLSVPAVPSITATTQAELAASLGLPASTDLSELQAKASSVNSWLGSSRNLMPAGFDINKLSVPSIPGHIPKIPSIPGVPSIPLKIDGFASGGAIDTSLYTKTPNEDLTYTGDDHIVWDRVNTERLNRGLPDLAALGYPRPQEPVPPPGATPNGTPGVFQMLGTIASEGPILPHLQYLAQVSEILPDPVDVSAVSAALANIQVALDQEQGALTSAGVDLKYDGPTGYVGVTAFAEKLHQIGVDKQGLGLDRFIEELALAADSPGGDSVIAALYEGKNLAA